MEIEVQLRMLNQAWIDLKNRERSIRNQREELYDLCLQMQKLEDQAMRRIAEKMRQQCESLDHQNKKLGLFSKALEEVIQLYKQIERQLCQ